MPNRTTILLRALPTIWIDGDLVFNRTPGQMDRVRRLTTFRVSTARGRKALRAYDAKSGFVPPRTGRASQTFPKKRRGNEPALFFDSVPEFQIEDGGGGEPLVNVVYAEDDGRYSFFMLLSVFRELIDACELLLAQHDGQKADVVQLRGKR